MSHSSKLHPIYQALDHGQYNRAIKLCLQQKAAADNNHNNHNLHVQALLAHAYVKADQRSKALPLLCHILLTHTPGQSTVEYFMELRLAHQYAQTGQTASGATAVTQPPSATTGNETTTTTPRKGGGKKGKKKTVSPVKAPSAATTPPLTPSAAPDVDPDWDWIDALDREPALSAETFAAIPTWPVPPDLADPGLLSTITVTLQLLRLTLTSYQVSYWWANTLTNNNKGQQQRRRPPPPLSPADLLQHLRDTFHEGITVWMAPQYQHLPVRTTVLPQLQVLALQMARWDTGVVAMDQVTTTLWAAQTALWQCNDSARDGDASAVEPQKLALLPRLAENLAAKPVPPEDTSRLTAEGFLLYLRALRIQDKWQEYLDAVNEKLDMYQNDQRGKPVMGLSPAMLLDWKSTAAAHLDQVEAAREAAAQSLREENPDQWDMWIRHLDHDQTEGYEATVTLAQELSLSSDASSPDHVQRQYPRRGPPLAILEALQRRIVAKTTANDDKKDELMEELLMQIQSYGDEFGSQTACTFADLTVCLNCIRDHGDAKTATTLMPWLYKMRQRPAANESSKRRAELRAFIFAYQTTLRLLHDFPELQKDWLPDWKELVRAWKEFQLFEDAFKAAQTEEERKNAQKESRPADEVILLAVQLLLHDNSTTHGYILAATLLEKAIEQSPYNAYLKLFAIFVYAELNAVSRSWDLFKDLFIKHIQYESCAYLILHLLRAGGMYQEVIQVCQDIIRLQRAALRDAGEYTAKALDNGTLSKAEEFIMFQRDRMNKSLTSLEAKGLVMDCAPMFKQDDRQADIGAMHGVVGGEEDMERVHLMINEAHNPQGSFSILRVNGSITEMLPTLSENRDLNALAYQVFRFESFPSTEQIVRDCIRRSHHHNLLLRAALCVDATKGPKKGKVAKSSEALVKRCQSLVTRVNEAEAFAESELQSPTGYGFVLLSMTKLCRAIAVLSGGFVTNDPAEQDSVSFREEQTAGFLQEAVEKLKTSREHLGLNVSVSASGLALPDLVIPLLALLRMCAKVNELYGWTKKRRTIRKCAGCLYDFVLALRSLLDDIEESLQAVELDHSGFALPDGLEEGVVPEIVSSDDVGESVFLVHGAQGQTKMRLERIVGSVRAELTSFDTEE